MDLIQKIDEVKNDLLKKIDPFEISDGTVDILKHWVKNPKELFNRLQKYYYGIYSLNFEFYSRLLTLDKPRKIPHNKWDKRFNEAIWHENDYWMYIMDWYLFNEKWLLDTISETPELDEKTKMRMSYWGTQLFAALSPTNFLFLNPSALRKIIETNGRSIFQSMRNFLDDLKNKRPPRLTDTSAFTVGVNIATTEGDVVFRNHLIELIRYKPLKDKVRKVPILLVPAWINKFYIFDISPKRSLVRYLLENGFETYVISWKNATSEMQELSLEDYMYDGILTAILKTREFSGSETVHPVGYCVGGILLSTLMAYLHHPDEQENRNLIQSWTILTTMVDFSNPGPIQAYITDRSLDYLSSLMNEKGYLDGKNMLLTFRMLRSTQLFWQTIRSQYLMGEDLHPDEILYWNMDSTRIPEKTHAFYLRNYYKDNLLCKNRKLSIKGRFLNLGDIDKPVYAVAAEDDHIAPWKETFKISKYFNTEINFTLTASGHVLGIVNPPTDEEKKHFWHGKVVLRETESDWIARTQKFKGTWWRHWIEWLHKQTGELINSSVTPREKSLGAAPGTYVLE